MIIQDHERFKNICSSIQSLAIAVAVIIGGLWTAYVFDSELKVENARAQLEKTNRELETKSNLEFELSAGVISTLNSENRAVEVIVNIHNKGSRATVLTFERPTFRAAKIKFLESGQIEFEKVVTAEPTLIDSRGAKWEYPWKRIASGEIDAVNFLVKVDSPGIYLLMFEAAGVDADTKDAWEEGVPQTQDVITWAASKYINVE